MENFTPGQIRILRETVKSIPESLLCEPVKEELIEYIPEMWQQFVNPTVNNKPILNDDESQVIAKLLMFELSMMSLFIDSKQGDGFLVFSPLIASIANSMAAIEQLATTGFDFQAYTLMRTLVEQYIALITITLCPEKRKSYYKAIDKKDEREVWYKLFTKKKFLEMMNEYKADPQGLLNDHLESVYSRLSSFTHNSFWHNFSKTYVPNSDGAGVKMNLFGEYVSRAEQIIRDLVFEIWPFHMLFFSVLNDGKTDINIEMIEEKAKFPVIKRVFRNCHTIEYALVARLIRRVKEETQTK